MNLDEAATRAAQQFLGEEFQLELLGHSQSLTYRVDTAGGRYLLRVHEPLSPPTRPGFHDPEAIESECAWLQALKDETELVVPGPLPAPGGGYVLRLPGRTGDETVPCTMLRWVEGEHVQGEVSPEQAANLGRLLAELHTHAELWDRPPEFVRPLLDREWTREAVERLRALVADGVLQASDHEALSDAVDDLVDELVPHASEPGRTGLIHGDLHDANYVLHDGRPCPIDFSGSGFGPWLYDIAECAMHLLPPARRDLVDAYAERRPLAGGDVRWIEGYLIAAVVETFGYHAPNPAERESLVRSVPFVAARHAARYLEGRPFLFEL